MKSSPLIPVFWVFVLTGFGAAHAQDTTKLLNWTANDGKVIPAKFIKLDEESVVIEKDEEEFVVPFAKLSAASVALAKKLGSEALKKWTSNDGRVIRARFITIDGESMIIEKDGKEITVPFEKLAPESVTLAKKLGSEVLTMVESEMSKAPDRFAMIPPKLSKEAKSAFARGYKYFIWTEADQPLVLQGGWGWHIAVKYVAWRKPAPVAFWICPITGDRQGKPTAEEAVVSKGIDKPIEMQHDGTQDVTYINPDWNRALSGKGPCLIQFMDYFAPGKEISNVLSVQVDFQ